LLLEWIEQSSGVVGLASQVDHLLGVGRVLLLIDGIDELDRKSVSTVSQVLRRFASAYPDSRLMMSCRTFGYEEFARSESDLLTWVCPLVDEQIHDFLKSWYHDDVSVKSLFRVIQENRSVRTLARNPLFLTMLVTIWGHDKHIPVSVYSLYERAVELLLGDWDRIRGVFRENQYKSSLKKDLLTTLAVRHAKAIEPSMSLQRTFAALTHEGIHIASTLVEFGSIIEEIEKHSGLIQRVTRDHWRFSHSSFAEFFCARAVVDRPPGEIAEDIRDSRDVHAWIPILALAASALDQDVATKRIGTILAQAMWKTEADRIRSIAARDREIFRGTRGSASKSTERS
jgi:predicted NACHT family NTPase